MPSMPRNHKRVRTITRSHPSSTNPALAHTPPSATIKRRINTCCSRKQKHPHTNQR
ncbi:hypothetical protein XF_1066 [Xylella fastidiosa 9a5c]|uniref:Uncharacterized protein n=1 Tax=Xylella fastidiosa (strain 9a5c) TaxID=160492 RepID=Q9PEG2_XYLFA|nr:hypothetical protein XF_1066 [Xylella fastidiosa 9a5c]